MHDKAENRTMNDMLYADDVVSFFFSFFKYSDTEQFIEISKLFSEKNNKKIHRNTIRTEGLINETQAKTYFCNYY